MQGINEQRGKKQRYTVACRIIVYDGIYKVSGKAYI